jgi:hypothetical protein
VESVYEVPEVGADVSLEYGPPDFVPEYVL